MLKENLSACALDERVTCAGAERLFLAGSRRPIQPSTSEIANAFSIELRQRGRTVVKLFLLLIMVRGLNGVQFRL